MDIHVLNPTYKALVGQLFLQLGQTASNTMVTTTKLFQVLNNPEIRGLMQMSGARTTTFYSPSKSHVSQDLIAVCILHGLVV